MGEPLVLPREELADRIGMDPKLVPLPPEMAEIPLRGGGSLIYLRIGIRAARALYGDQAEIRARRELKRRLAAQRRKARANVRRARVARAQALRAEGKSWTQISEDLGVHKWTCWNLVKRGTAALAALWVGAFAPAAASQTSVIIPWPIDVFLDERMTEPADWVEQLQRRIADVNRRYQDSVDEWDVSCPVEVQINTLNIYRVGERGFREGGGPQRNLQLPQDLVRRWHRALPTTRLYIGPYRGWSFADVRWNAAYAWMGDRGSPRADPPIPPGKVWRRSGWVLAHELGHLAGLHHRTVREPEQCSLMVSEPQHKPIPEICTQSARKLTEGDCQQILEHAVEQLGVTTRRWWGVD